MKKHRKDETTWQYLKKLVIRHKFFALFMQTLLSACYCGIIWFTTQDTANFKYIYLSYFGFLALIILKIFFIRFPKYDTSGVSLLELFIYMNALSITFIILLL